MKFFRFVSTLIFTFCFFVFSTQSIFANTKVQIPQDADFWSDFPHEDLANFLVENMTNDELLAQILMFGWATDHMAHHALITCLSGNDQ